jgi:hypothetical protein
MEQKMTFNSILEPLKPELMKLGNVLKKCGFEYVSEASSANQLPTPSTPKFVPMVQQSVNEAKIEERNF